MPETPEVFVLKVHLLDGEKFTYEAPVDAVVEVTRARFGDFVAGIVAQLAKADLFRQTHGPKDVA